MCSDPSSLFFDKAIIKIIQQKLPAFFRIAEYECSRNGKIGMEVGSVREKILIALLIRKFGKRAVLVDTPITAPEIDVKVFDRPISIKTLTGLSGIKLIWTVDAIQAIQFAKKYKPSCDMLIAQMFWGKDLGGLFYIKKETQERVLTKTGRNNYIKLPKQGTNPRGVELSKDALSLLLSDKDTLKIPVNWIAKNTNPDIYARWVEAWKN